MTTPKDATKPEQGVEEEPEGIRRLREEYSPEEVDKILDGIRQGLDDYKNGRYINFADYLEECGEDADELMDAYLEKHGMTRDDLK